MYRDILYQGSPVRVYDDGRIFHLGKWRLYTVNHDGYPVCSIKIDGIWKRVGIHRLVATAFVPNPNCYDEVNHLDFDRMNFNPDNLEWVSHRDNLLYSHVHGRYAKRYGQDNPNYGNHKLAKIYFENPSLSLIKQSRPGIQNGRARRITMVDKDGQCITFDTIGLCCQYLIESGLTVGKTQSVRSKIDLAVRNGSTYLGYHFIKHNI